MRLVERLFRFLLEPYDYRIWILILLVTLHGVAIMVFLFEYFQKTMSRLPSYEVRSLAEPLTTSAIDF